MDAFDGLIYICSQDYRIGKNSNLIGLTGYDGTGLPGYKVLHELDMHCPWCVSISFWVMYLLFQPLNPGRIYGVKKGKKYMPKIVCKKGNSFWSGNTDAPGASPRRYGAPVAIVLYYLNRDFW